MALQTCRTGSLLGTCPRGRRHALAASIVVMLAAGAWGNPRVTATGPQQQLAATAAPAQITTFDGQWVWAEARPQSIARLDIEGTSVRAYLRCPDELCDIGTATSTVYWNPTEPRDNPTALRVNPVDPARLKVADARRNQVAVLRAGAALGEATPVALVASFRTGFRTLMVIVSPPVGEGLSRTIEVEMYTELRDAPQPSRETVTFTTRRVMMMGDLPHEIPQLEFPLPRPSLRQVLEQDLVARRGETLGTAFDRLERALQRAEIPQWSVYGIGDGGFAIISQAERINDDGSALSGSRRWPPPLAQVDPSEVAQSITDYLRQLFFGAGVGRYRVIVFAVTDKSLDVSPEPPDPAQIDEFLVGGARHLPEAMRSAVLGADGRCEVLIYEFTRAAPEDRTRLVAPSGIRMDGHLSGAGLWPVEELRQ